MNDTCHFCRKTTYVYFVKYPFYQGYTCHECNKQLHDQYIKQKNNIITNKLLE